MFNKYSSNKETSERIIKKAENKSAEYRNNVLWERRNKDESPAENSQLKGSSLVVLGNIRHLRAAGVIKIVTQNQRGKVIIFFLPKY